MRKHQISLEDSLFDNIERAQDIKKRYDKAASAGVIAVFKKAFETKLKIFKFFLKFDLFESNSANFYSQICLLLNHYLNFWARNLSLNLAEFANFSGLNLGRTAFVFKFAVSFYRQISTLKFG